MSALWLLVTVCGCRAPGATSHPSAEVPPDQQATIRSDISASLDRQVKAWNDGDVDGFMRGYWRDAKLTFLSGGTATFGWDATLTRYHHRYPNRKAMGSLTFSDLNIKVIAPTTATVWGRWHLDRTNPIGGLFTLIFRRLGNEWLIVHDHTSMGE